MTALEPELGQPVDLSSRFTPEVPQPVEVAPTLTPEQITANLNGTPAPTGQPARDTTAVIPNLPDTQAAFTRKYQRLAPLLSNVPSKTRATLIQMDWERTQKGQAPLSDKQTLAAIIQAAQSEQLTKKESGDGGIVDTIVDIPGNAVKDIGLILKSIPQLPGALVNEVTSLDDFGKVMAENQRAGMNPLAALLNAPGVRMIPGAYVAGNVARGTEGLKDLAEHPTITALDLLPYAGKLAAGTKVAQVAAIEKGATVAKSAADVAAAAGKDPAAMLATLEQLSEQAGRRAMRGARPLRPVLTKKLLPEGMVDPITQSRLTPNALGRVTEKAAKSSLGQMLNEAFGPMARDTGAAAMIANEQLQRVYNTEMPVEGLAATARQADDLYLNAAERFGVTDADRVELARLAEIGDEGWVQRLPAQQKAFIDEAQAIRRQIESEAIARGLGEIVDGEFYDPAQAKNLVRRRNRYTRAVEKFQEGKGAKMAALTDEYRAGMYGPDVAVPVLDRVGEGVKQQALEKVEELARVLDEAADPASSTTWGDALKVINARLQGRTNIGSPSQVGGRLRNAPQATDRLGTLASLRDEVRRLEAARRLQVRAEAAPPARFIPRVEKEGLELARTRLIESGQDPEAAARLVTDVNYRTADPSVRRIVDKSLKETAATWQKMKAAGHDPMWVHRVTLGREGSVIRPQITGRAITPSIAKSRTIGADPIYFKDIAVGLDHAAFEMLRNDVTDGMTSYISKAHGLPEAELLARYEAAGIAKAANNPYLSPREWAVEAMRRDWVPFDPAKYGGYAQTGSPVMIPKVVAKSLNRMFDPHPTGILNSAVFDKTTGLFRTSVLALSPRWHIYNVVGGAIMLGAEDLRAFSPSNISKSIKVLKAAKAGEQVLPDRMQFALGSTLKELDADRASILAGADEASKLRRLAESKPGQAAAAFVKGSYKLNGFADDVYRVMSYLNGEKQALGKGLDDLAAQEVAMESVRRTSQVWVELSPFERQVLRKVFPFYSFTAKIMKLVTQYPFDHPVRAAVMANIAEAELADMGDALPTDWLSTTGIGSEDENGDQTRLSWRGLNPFNDVGDMFTFAGFLQGMNPLIATAGEQLAGDPYAEKVYNPETGKLEQPKPNLLRSLISNTVPQAGAFAAATGLDKSMADLKRTNPEAYQRMIASGFGVPTGFRTYNQAETKIMAELNRQTTQREAWAAFLRSGDTTEVEKYPALRPLIPVVQRLRESGQLQAYNPVAGAQSGASGAVTAIASQAPWPT